MLAGAALQAWEARLLASGYPAEERVLRRVQPRQHILQHVAMQGGVVRELGTNGLELGFLLRARAAGQTWQRTQAVLRWSRATLERVRQRHTTHDALQRTLLSGRGLELLLGGLAHTLLVHTAPYWSILVHTGPYWSILSD